jgi:hypothetical protein
VSTTGSPSRYVFESPDSTRGPLNARPCAPVILTVPDET